MSEMGFWIPAVMTIVGRALPLACLFDERLSVWDVRRRLPGFLDNLHDRVIPLPGDKLPARPVPGSSYRLAVLHSRQISLLPL